MEALWGLTETMGKRLEEAESAALKLARAEAVWVAEHKARAAKIAQLERARAAAKTRASERGAAAADAANDLVKVRASIARHEKQAKRSETARRCWSPLDPEFLTSRRPDDMLAALEIAQSGLLARIDDLERVKIQFRLVSAPPASTPSATGRRGLRRSARLAARAHG